MQRLSQFWQELKHRNVVRRNTVYAATAFVILELVSIIQEPLKLPEWTLPLAIIFLSIGFIVSIVISWIYDFSPDGGLEKTKPVHKVKNEDKPVASSNWKIASLISFVVIVALIVLNIIPRSDRPNKKMILDKSIAVLPFTYLSDESDKQYLADGTMDEILLNLSKIRDLRVMSKTSVEQYRNTDKTITEICEELDVAFLLEGSFQKSGNQVRLIVQLIEPGKEGHAWAKKYDRSWEDIFAVQSEIAQLVAKELHAVISPKERQLIEKIPTGNLTAYDFYQRGMEEFDQVLKDKNNRGAMERAEKLFHKSLEYDSTFAQAYVLLAWVYWHKNIWEASLSENFLDSVLILADIALSFDDQLASAYIIRGEYYLRHNKKEQAINDFNKALSLNPNDWEAYSSKGWFYIENFDLVKAIDNLQKAASLHRGHHLPIIYRGIAYAYADAGFKEQSYYYVKEALKLDDDSVLYYSSLADIEDTYSNFGKAIELAKKSLAIDSTDWWVMYSLGVNHSFIGLFEESMEYFKEYDKKLKAIVQPEPSGKFRLGHAYRINGFNEEADYYIKAGLDFYIEILELDIRPWHHEFFTFYNLAAMYAFIGDRVNAYDNLKVLNQNERMPLEMVTYLKNDPLFDSIRGEPEFQQIVRDVEAKYQAEHERVRQWLEENVLL